MYSMPEMSFNINDGYLEGLVRGFKGGILRQGDYLNLVQCEILEGKLITGRPTPSTIKQYTKARTLTY